MLNLFKKRSENKNHDDQQKGIVGEYFENGFPVIVKFVSELPAKGIVSKMKWFTVISWNYDGSQNNGMPPEAINQRMLLLEEALDKAFRNGKITHHAYNRTGNSLKEFNYYISDRDKFMSRFNSALAKHERYPIEINFYEDPDWSEMNRLIEDFKPKQ
ncbi:DUF695 domain-containing protein [Aureitalea marina]|uniref:DUF695 domain-containing protein n=1 Tax=Aureitalea marina TaxID=930804 RepID=UPI000CF1C94E|nr:DUF695 domain-containing protein [Aureitalea marina]